MAITQNIVLQKDKVPAIADTIVKMVSDKTFEKAQWLCGEKYGKPLYLVVDNLAGSVAIYYEERMPVKYSVPIDHLNISAHTYNCLRRAGITTLGQILEKGIDHLCDVRGFGVKSKEEMEIALKQANVLLVSGVEKEKDEKLD